MGLPISHMVMQTVDGRLRPRPVAVDFSYPGWIQRIHIVRGNEAKTLDNIVVARDGMDLSSSGCLVRSTTFAGR